MNFDSTWVKIDLDAVDANFDAIAKKAGVPVMAVIKADAYGHGAVPVARKLAGKCGFFAVSSVLEALELRQAGIAQPILILGHTPVEAFPTVIQKGIRPAIWQMEEAQALSRAAAALGMEAPFHLVVDTGMSRIGVQATYEEACLCAKMAALPGLKAEGLFSHFATADCADLSRAEQQRQRFVQFDTWLRELGVEVKLRHLDNSAGLMNFSQHFEMVRSGIITYGLYPSEEVDPALLALKPAMSFYSEVTHVKLLPAGREISYGGTYVTQGDTRVATVSVGYADGYRRSLSGKFHVLIRGKRAPILGRVCMDQLMVDVTDIPGTQVGDQVTLIGSDGEEVITMEAIAEAAGSFNYEFACGVSRRVPRKYVSGGRIVQAVHYLTDHKEDRTYGS